MSNYQVLFSGEIAEGAHEHTVRENVCRELGIDQRKATQLFSGRTVVIRSNLTQDEALALQGRFADLGALCRIKDLTPKLEEKKLDYRIDRAERFADHTLRDITAAHVECPRCGHLQLEASHCARCGIDIAAAIKAQRKEDLIIEKKIRELKEKGKPSGSENVSRFVPRANDRLVVAGSANSVGPRGRTGPDKTASGKSGKIKSWFKKSS
jgi:ribosomal protein L37E